MDQKLLDSLIEQIQKQRREWAREDSESGDRTRAIAQARKRDLRERALRKRVGGEEDLDDKRDQIIRELDAVLARIEAGTFGVCEKCGRTIEHARLSSDPTVRLCSACAEKAARR